MNQLIQPHAYNSLDLSLPKISIIYSTYYYRWSTPAQVRERKFSENKLVSSEKDIVKAEISKLIEAVENYKGYCSVCNKEIKVIFTGTGYADLGKTGRTADRENIQKLLEDAKSSSFQAVFTPYSSRLGRKRSVTATLRDSLKDLGIQIISLHQPIPLKCPACYDPMDDDSSVITETMSDMQAELELSQIRRNYRNGMPVRIRKGKPSGSLGYGLIKKIKIIGKDERGNDLIAESYEWDEDKIMIVKRIAKEYLNGAGLWKIIKALNDESIPSPQGKDWLRSAIKHVLRNPIYKGYVRFGWKPVKNGKRPIQPEEKWLLCKAQFKGIWTEEYHRKIQEEYGRRGTIGSRAQASNGLLIGILKCAYCHSSMFQTHTRKMRLNGNEYHYRGYSCGKFMHGGICKSNGVKQNIIDNMVLDEVLKLANEKTREEFYKNIKNSKQKTWNDQLELKRKALVKYSIQLERANKAYLKGIDTIEDYSKNKAVILPEIEKLRSEIPELERKIKDNKGIKWQKAYELALERFKQTDTPQIKRQVKTILSRLIEKIEFRKKPFNLKIYYRLLPG